MKHLRKSILLGGIFVLSIFILLLNLFIINNMNTTPVLAANDHTYIVQSQDSAAQASPCSCSADTLSCELDDFNSQEEAQACFDYCQSTVGFDIHQLDGDNDGLACEGNLPSIPMSTPETEDASQTEDVSEAPRAKNLVFNGNFEFGFYQVPELGFEPPHVGNVPINWNWYKNQAYGKYVIDNNQRLGIVCADDIEATTPVSDTGDGVFGPIPEYEVPPPSNALDLHMQSTDQNDARLGVYQTINVVPGQDYRFSMSATIQVQAGGRIAAPHDPNHTFELYFDHSGGTDWSAIPHEKWSIIPIKEQKLFFTLEEAEKKGESALSEIEDYETIVTAKSDEMTIFLTAWRKWANWRTTIFIVDCVALTPLNPAGYPGSPAAAAAPPPAPTPFVEVQAASLEQPVQPETSSTDSQAETASPENTTTIIPDSGGVLDGSSNTILFVMVSLLVILGLVGAGIWNMRRR